MPPAFIAVTAPRVSTFPVCGADTRVCCVGTPAALDAEVATFLQWFLFCLIGSSDRDFARSPSHTTGRAVFRIRRLNSAALTRPQDLIAAGSRNDAAFGPS